MNTTPDQPLSYMERIAQLWREGNTCKQIAIALDITVERANQRVCNARRLLGIKQVPFRSSIPRVPFSTARWEPIAALWRDGKSSGEIATILKVHPSINSANLVITARRYLGIEAVPLRPRKAILPPHAPITMTEMGRHYLRRVGEEFIFRTESGTEEVWTKTQDPSGMVWPRRGYGRNSPVRLAFKNVMGLTEKRV